MPVIVPWEPTEAANQVLRYLQSGQCVALPTESTYELVASAHCIEAVDQLSRAVVSGEFAAIVLSDYAQLHDWMPRLTGAGTRLFRKLGAGPYTFRGRGGYEQGLAPRLPDSARRLVVRDDRLALRWPDQPIWAKLGQAGLPLVSLPLPGAVNMGMAVSLVGENAACIVDAGAAQHALPPSIVEADGRRCRLTRAGALTGEQLDALTCSRILFVCTGNTCRSPMAEALCAKLLTDRLGGTRADLLKHGFSVQSAGLAAMMGNEASSEAVQVASDLGADLSAHRSAPATIAMLQWADFVFAMTASHWYSLKSANVPGAPTPRMLSPLFEDVVDPIGAGLLDYQTCARQILDSLQQRLPEILESM